MTDVIKEAQELVEKYDGKLRPFTSVCDDEHRAVRIDDTCEFTTDDEYDYITQCGDYINIIKGLLSVIDRMKLGQLFPATKDNLPKVGQKFVAMYNDGSGGACFQRVSINGYKGYLGDTLTDHDWFFEAGYFEWLPLPDDFKLWFEQKGE